MDYLRENTGIENSEFFITVPNIGFIVTRIMLFFGYFNYGRKGILDRTHTRLFTFSSIQTLLRQSGYRIIEVKGIPAPYPKAVGDGMLSRFLLSINIAAIFLARNLFCFTKY
jgi:hypothetical protein